MLDDDLKSAFALSEAYRAYCRGDGKTEAGNVHHILQTYTLLGVEKDIADQAFFIGDDTIYLRRQRMHEEMDRLQRDDGKTKKFHTKTAKMMRKHCRSVSRTSRCWLTAALSDWSKACVMKANATIW